MRIVLGGGSNFGFSYSLTCLLVLFVISSANAKEVGLVCDVSGQTTVVGEPPTRPYDVLGFHPPYKAKKFASVRTEGDEIVDLVFDSESCEFLHCTGSDSLNSRKSSNSRSFGFIKEYEEGIRKFKQVVWLNRFTLGLEVEVQWVYVKPPLQGFRTSYSGICSIVEKKL